MNILQNMLYLMYIYINFILQSKILYNNDKIEDKLQSPPLKKKDNNILFTIPSRLKYRLFPQKPIKKPLPNEIKLFNEYLKKINTDINENELSPIKEKDIIEIKSPSFKQINSPPIDITESNKIYKNLITPDSPPTVIRTSPISLKNIDEEIPKKRKLLSITYNNGIDIYPKNLLNKIDYPVFSYIEQIKKDENLFLNRLNKRSKTILSMVRNNSY